MAATRWVKGEGEERGRVIQKNLKLLTELEKYRLLAI